MLSLREVPNLEIRLRNSRAGTERFSGAVAIAGILASAGGVGASGGRISEMLASGSARNLSQAIDQLNPSERNALQARWGRSLDELISLSNERDARVFHHGLLQVGRRLEDNDQVDLAGVVYSGLAGGATPHPALRPPSPPRGEGQITLGTSVSTDIVSPSPLGGEGARRADEGSAVASIAAQAQRRLNAINGVGDWRERFAFSLQRIPGQATRWDVLLAMTGAGFTFRGFRLLTTASWAGSFESALALNAASASTAFLAETIAFTSLGKVAGALAGHPQDTSANGIFNEWAGGAAMLLGLKGMGALTGAGVRSIYGEGVAATATGRLTQILAPQAGMFMGILVGNRLAEAGGFHPERHGDTWLVDGITTLIEFNVAGRLQRAAGGPALTSLEARMDAMTRNIGHGSGRPGGIWDGRSKDRPLPGMLEVISDLMQPELVTPEGLRLPSFENRPSKIENPNAVFSVRHDGETGPTSVSTLSTTAAPQTRPAGNSGIQIFPLIEAGRNLTFHREFENALDRIAEKIQLLEIYTDYQGIERPLSPTENGLQELRFRFSRTLYDSPALGEIRVHLGDGSMMWVARNNHGRMLYGYETTEVAREVERTRSYPQDRTQSFFLTAPKAAESIEQSLWSRVFNVLRERSGLSRQEVADRLNEKTGSASDRYTIGKIENHGNDGLQFDRLRALGEIFGVPTADLAQVLNLSRHQQGLYEGLNPQHWETETHPLYLETRADLERVHFYKDQDPERKSVGWLIYSARKNPESYLNLVQLSDATGISLEILTDMELNRPHYLTLANFTRLSETLSVPLFRLLQAANRTRHPTLALERLFPGQALYLDPDSEDVAKVELYQSRAGTVGQLLFALRHSLEGFPSGVALSRRLGRRINFWGDREWNRVPFDRKNWREIVEVFSILDRPIFPLEKHLKRLGLDLDSPEVLLTEGLRGESLLDFNQRSGIAPRTVALAMLPKKDRTPALLLPETILALQRSLPQLRGDLLYRRMYPEVSDIFGPLDATRPVLPLKPNQVDAAMNFHLGESLFAYRMEMDLTLAELGEKIGTNAETVFRHESRVVDTLDTATMAPLAKILRIDPRLLYTHYHPEILGLFELEGLPSDLARLSLEEYDRLLAAKSIRRDPTNRRAALREAMATQGLESEADLARFLGVSNAQAEKLLKSSRNLSVEEIQSITRAFPKLSYRAWYEHFNAPAIAYFLGRTADGSIDYRIPEGLDVSDLAGLDLAARIRETAQRIYPSIHHAIRVTGASFLDNPVTLADTVRRRTWEDMTIARLSQSLQIDRRLLYMFMKLPELRPMLAGDGAAPPPDTKTRRPRLSRR